MEQIYIYGDSLLKATVPDESFRYHFHLPEVMNWYPSERVAVTNRSKMGATSTKGLQLVEHDVARGMDARYALVAYGGNDSDYDWLSRRIRRSTTGRARSCLRSSRRCAVPSKRCGRRVYSL